ncbi:MAG: hypothetical protein A2Y61_03925 [Chloroflexi bacterium RBG_13_60_13]|nr:MAG: hypothetical protein A2Y61_03925 [Chloroflexi bacterium RBG_13_60_13]
MTQREPAADLGLWRLLKAWGAHLRRQTPEIRALPIGRPCKVLPFPNGRHRRRPTRRNPQ